MDNKKVRKITSSIFSITILYYIYYLEKSNCNCIRSWYHNFIKYYSIYVILRNIITFIAVDATTSIEKDISNRNMYIFDILLVIYLYSIYMYVGELEKTKCECAIINMKYIHNLLYYIRYILMTGVFLKTISIMYDIYNKYKDSILKLI